MARGAGQLSAAARLTALLLALLLLPAPAHAAPPTTSAAPPTTSAPPRRRPRPVLVEDADGGDVLLPDDDEPGPDPDYIDEPDANNTGNTEKGTYLGSRCEFTCNPKLHHVFCHPVSGRCECDAKHSVQLGPTKGCAKPKKLGEQCFYRQTCRAYDPHASCIQHDHKAHCECEPGYHSVTYSRPVQKVFCTEDMALLTADVPTLLGVVSGIFVLAGLLCMVLHLYTRARYPRRATHLADAAMTPPCMYSLNDTGGTISVGGRPSSRSSIRSAATGGTIDSGGSRRESRARGVVVSASRAGSRRPSMSSVQSSTSSIRSYSMRRFEKEREQKEKRQQMQLRLAQLHANMTGGPTRKDMPKHAPTPSPRSPNNSTDGLLPAVCEIRELASLEQGTIGPCTSSSLY